MLKCNLHKIQNGTVYTNTHTNYISILAYKIIRYKIFITKHYRISSSLNLSTVFRIRLTVFAIICYYFSLVHHLKSFSQQVFHSLKICVWNTCTIYSIQFDTTDSTLDMKPSSNTKIIYKSFQSFLLELDAVNRGLHKHTLWSDVLDPNDHYET